ncbi:sensor histidine kinase [Kineosporia sp. NBRC 101731]|uniref:sensor histidine kinase n=1 Tax=Kineosporia sp. NBRC 101731 TaxID=3032199 RepID=UPI0024A22F91|nr:sensor histidine kinase [Kineosporia sp. NBRC 101731]GLY29933.1 two-component sensor histidine kinase [Kineosporia sp. NBRC 101731]
MPGDVRESIRRFRDDLGHWPGTVVDLTIAMIVATAASNDSREWLPGVLTGVAMAVALVWRRHRPVGVFAVVSLLGVLEVLFSPEMPLAHDVAVAVAMVTVVYHAPRLRHAYLAGLLWLLGLAALTVRSAWPLTTVRPDGPEIAYSIAVLGLFTAVWLTPYVLRTRRLLVSSLQERALTAEREREHLNEIALADERAAIARELHDVVAHSLAVMIVQADGAGYALRSSPDKAEASLRTIAAVGREALDDMHRIVDVLRGSGKEQDDDRRRVSLERLGPLTDQARQAGLEVDLAMTSPMVELTEGEQLTIVRIVQEGLTNVLRHAGPGTRVRVSVTFGDDGAVVELTDNGGRVGTPRVDTGRSGTGLAGMQERIASHGGSFEAGPHAGVGWRVTARMPVRGLLS